jgi:bifunctional UDP-N-acetylglucosamine pyrophosphorylase / glucosamine-1-phosphate N-acetyltransferase
MHVAAIILAAGQGTRMKSNVPKVLHPIAGKAMVWHVVDAVRKTRCEKVALVIGHGADQVRALFSNLQTRISNLQFVEQRKPLGTGHAVLQARDLLRGSADAILVLHADHPLVLPATLKSLVERHRESNATITMLTVHSEDSMGFGRVLRDGNNNVVGVVEESEANDQQIAIHELNCGMYCFDAEWLWEHLHKIQPSGEKQEYYLTDLIGIAVGEKSKVDAVTASDPTEVIGINTRVHLARAEKSMRHRINETLMLAGVTIVDPDNTYIDVDVEIGEDTTVEPNTHLSGKTRVGSRCLLGPNTIVRDARIGDDCSIVSSVIEEATVGDHVEMGPFAHLRPGAFLARGVHLGNYVEVKNSRLGEETQAGHFCYLGDAEIGARVNIGAGTITVNYDGKQKNKTIIGDNAFIGSDTMLVAPVTIGARARTGAGSVVTKNVPPGMLAVGVPARVIRKLEPGA